MLSELCLTSKKPRRMTVRVKTCRMMPQRQAISPGKLATPPSQLRHCAELQAHVEHLLAFVLMCRPLRVHMNLMTRNALLTASYVKNLRRCISIGPKRALQ